MTLVQRSRLLQCTLLLPRTLILFTLQIPEESLHKDMMKQKQWQHRLISVFGVKIHIQLTLAVSFDNKIEFCILWQCEICELHQEKDTSHFSLGSARAPVTKCAHNCFSFFLSPYSERLKITKMVSFLLDKGRLVTLALISEKKPLVILFGPF